MNKRIELKEQCVLFINSIDTLVKLKWWAVVRKHRVYKMIYQYHQRLRTLMADKYGENQVIYDTPPMTIVINSTNQLLIVNGRKFTFDFMKSLSSDIQLFKHFIISDDKNGVVDIQYVNELKDVTIQKNITIQKRMVRIK